MMTDYAQEAHDAIKDLKNNRGEIISTGQVRKILYLANTLASKSDVLIANKKITSDGNINDEIRALLVNMKVKIAYQIGRDESSFLVKDYIAKTKIFEKIDNILKTEAVKDLKNFVLYNEALVAYHKFEEKNKKTPPPNTNRPPYKPENRDERTHQSSSSFNTPRISQTKGGRP